MEQVIYNILTFLIIGTALFIAGRKAYAKLFVKKESSCASGCEGCASKCELKSVVDLKKSTH
ncbi:MAG: hypothetical protein WCX31_03325 [Salinivirgaceae bacterium]